MRRFLLDTNVVSELRRSRPNAGVTAWFDRTHPQDHFVSVLTLGELRTGVELVRRRDPAQAEALDAWMTRLTGIYAARLVGVDPATTDLWGRLRAARPLSPTDAMLAATALLHGWTLVTRNIRDVEQTGCQVFNPFT